MTPEQQADDVHRLLSLLGGAPAHVFGSILPEQFGRVLHQVLTRRPDRQIQFPN